MDSSKYSDSLYYFKKPSRQLGLSLDVDICVYGGTSGGAIAAIAARRKGLSVVLLESSRHIGGMTAGGLSYTDIGNKHAIGGLSREFYRRVGAHYDMPECWLFEPSVAEKTYLDWLSEMGVECHFESFVEKVEMTDGKIVGLTTVNGISVKAKAFIDASYEGDLMALAGVSYTVGRESNAQYGELFNGAHVREKHQFRYDVDPYREEGNPDSGVLPGIETSDYVQGEGDHRVQAYNFRLCLTTVPENRIPFEKPADYRREDYELLARYCRAGYTPEFNKFDQLTRGKVDMNNHGAVSTDFIGQNFRFPDAGYEEREELFQAHVRWVKGLMWFWSQDKDVPQDFKDKISEWGWCKDEFTETGGFSHALYVREARRMVSDLVMTEKHCRSQVVVEDSVALAAYTMDSHNCRRIIVDGAVRNEGDVQVESGPPYPISYRAIVPRKGECRNLFVPFCLSASHIAFGSIRMEPVFMILSEVAVEAAALALEAGVDVQDVDYGALRKALEEGLNIVDPVPEVANKQSGE